MPTPHEIRTERDRRGITQSVAASELGVDRVTVARWETGASRVPHMVVFWLRASARKPGKGK